jgi:ATP-dependent Lon protease
MPKENAKDLRDIPKRVLKALRVVPVEHMDEVLRAALVLPDPQNFLKEASVAVDWRVPADRRENGGRDRREDSSRYPVASAVPPPSVREESQNPTTEVPLPTPSLRED